MITQIGFFGRKGTQEEKTAQLLSVLSVNQLAEISINVSSVKLLASRSQSRQQKYSLSPGTMETSRYEC